MLKQGVLASVLAFATGCAAAPGDGTETSVLDGGRAETGLVRDTSLPGDADARDVAPTRVDARADLPDTRVVDVGMPVVDVGMPVVDVGMPVVDVGMPVVDVPATGDTDLAAVASHTLPARLACGAATTALVTMRNTGTTRWSSGARYALRAVNAEDLFLTRGDEIPLGADVPPGGEITFTLQLSAPGAGTYPTRWRMVRGGVHLFGDVAASTVTVVCDRPFRVFPSVIDGTFGMPLHEQRIASRNAALLRHGHAITGNDAVDNAVLGGGSPDGGIWLSGSYHFEIDAAGQNTAASWITVFSAERFSVNGGIYPNGEIHMGSPVGVDISGLFKNGVVTGYVAEAGRSISFEGEVWNRLPVADRNYIRGIWHGADLSYVHGLMTGTGVLR